MLLQLVAQARRHGNTAEKFISANKGQEEWKAKFEVTEKQQESDEHKHDSTQQFITSAKEWCCQSQGQSRE